MFIPRTVDVDGKRHHRRRSAPVLGVRAVDDVDPGTPRFETCVFGRLLRYLYTVYERGFWYRVGADGMGIIVF